VWDFINYLEVRQFLEGQPELAFVIFVIMVCAIVAVVYALASFRLFTIVHEHHHHHYHPAPLPQEKNSLIQPVTVQQPAPPRPQGDSSLMGDLFAYLGNMSSSAPKATVNEPTPKPRSNRPKMSKSKRFAILRRDGFRCKLCGRGPDDGDDVVLHVDHRMPVAKGGDSTDDNLWTLCADCNGAKSDTIMEELFESSEEADSDGGK
jgi:5-methylcytosine-specific restriction endonuclease McrA